jgi:DNA-binding XRE family transcriptional regulator
MAKQLSLFLETFGDTPLLRALEFFLAYPDFDYTKSYVAKEIGISRITMEKVWKHLAKAGLIAKSRTLGKIEMWKLNKENPKVKVLMQTAVRLSFGYLESLKAPAIAHN